MRLSISVIALSLSLVSASSLPDQRPAAAFVIHPSISHHQKIPNPSSKCKLIPEKQEDGIAESGFFEHGFETDLDEKMDSIGEQYEQYREINEDFDSNIFPSEDDAAPKKNLPADYGFVSRGNWQKAVPSTSEEEYSPYYVPPSNIIGQAMKQFSRNLRTMLGKYKEDNKDDILDDKQMALQVKLASLKLSPDVVWDLEDIAGAFGVMKEPLVIRAPYHLLCPMIDLAFSAEGSYAPERFYIMEKIGRVPYLSFISMLNLYEMFGLWRPSEDVRVAHVHQELTKFRRQTLMEELGGDQPWTVRFVAEHAALLAQATIVHLWLISPSLAYRFALMIESHAYHTYNAFLDENKKLLKDMPAPKSLTKEDGPSATLYDVIAELFKTDNANHAVRLKESYFPSVALNAADTEKKLFGGLFAALLIGNFVPHSLGDGTFSALLEKIPGWP